jgi:hypothetical protein
MSDRNYDFCDDPLNELVASDARIEELEDELAETQSKILRWIPVTERLPPGDIRVLIWCGNFVDVATLNWKYGWMYDDYGSPEPTHWMPMPEPPEAK